MATPDSVMTAETAQQVFTTGGVPLLPPDENSVLGLLAGFGELPVSVVRQAKAWGWQVVAFCIHRDNCRALEKAGALVEKISPGLVGKNLELGKKHGITHVVFAGKVNKWRLLANPKLDTRAVEALQQLREHWRQCGDDDLMWGIIRLIEAEGMQVLPQTAFLQPHFVGEGHWGGPALTSGQQADIAYGWRLAKSMGGLDVGQSVVVHQGMALAIEAIEGTDECLKRAGKWGRKKGGTVVKVAKPQQDNRFDVPTVGLKTLKLMHRKGLTVLATEAHQTFFVDPEAMRAFADKHGISVVSLSSPEVAADDPGGKPIPAPVAPPQP